MPETIETDPTRLRQVLVNLVGNAIKFTEKGSVTLSMRLVEGESDNPKMEFTVADSGIGMTHRAARAVVSTVLAGGCLDLAAVRRHGPGADDQQANHRPSWAARSSSKANTARARSFARSSRSARSRASSKSPLTAQSEPAYRSKASEARAAEPGLPHSVGRRRPRQSAAVDVCAHQGRRAGHAGRQWSDGGRLDAGERCASRAAKRPIRGRST